MWSQGVAGGSVELSLARNLGGPYQIDVTGMALVNQNHPRQEISVEVNGTSVATWTYELAVPSGQRSAVIPGAFAVLRFNERPSVLGEPFYLTSGRSE